MTPKDRSKYSLTADCVIFGYAENRLHIALIERKNPPFKGKWALPGGFIEGDETVEEGAFRELAEETGISDVYLQQVHVFSKPDRDPRGRIITVAFFALVNRDTFDLIASEDAIRAVWWPVSELPELAFDHDEIFEEALKRLRQEIRLRPLAFSLLRVNFSLSELQGVIGAIMDTELDKRNFRKKVLGLPFIKETDQMESGRQHRPARLYSFDKKAYQEWQLLHHEQPII